MRRRFFVVYVSCSPFPLASLSSLVLFKFFIIFFFFCLHWTNFDSSQNITGYFTVYFNGESLVEIVDQLISFLLFFLHFIVFQVVFQWPWTYIVDMDSWWIKFAWIECKAFLNLNHANSIHQTKTFHLKLLRE